MGCYSVASLEHEFIILTLRSMNSLEDYCHKLKDVADQLSDVERSLKIVWSSNLFVDCHTTQSMLQLERNHQQTQELIAAPTDGLTASKVYVASDSSSRQP
uniref:Uncharacterized protein n=1 Tax=Lactuca sativa TaxID=4236 RepID=A0A9R1VAG0_LACSA|nr:hypothetical protein LSAT_V11C600299690 [Lactuca sativa]